MMTPSTTLSNFVLKNVASRYSSASPFGFGLFFKLTTLFREVYMGYQFRPEHIRILALGYNDIWVRGSQYETYETRMGHDVMNCSLLDTIHVVVQFITIITHWSSRELISLEVSEVVRSKATSRPT